MGKIKYTYPQDVILMNIDSKSSTSCWEWVGCLDLKGYGSIPTLKWARYYRLTSAHRYSYLIFNGDFDRKLFICHTCHNRCCVNPCHLYAGTAKDNIRDMHKSGRNKNVNGQRYGRSKLKDCEVRDIKLRLGRKEKGVDIAKLYDVGEKCISKIKTGVRWGHI